MLSKRCEPLLDEPSSRGPGRKQNRAQRNPQPVPAPARAGPAHEPRPLGSHRSPWLDGCRGCSEVWGLGRGDAMAEAASCSFCCIQRLWHETQSLVRSSLLGTAVPTAANPPREVCHPHRHLLLLPGGKLVHLLLGISKGQVRSSPWEPAAPGTALPLPPALPTHPPAPLLQFLFPELDNPRSLPGGSP